MNTTQKTALAFIFFLVSIILGYAAYATYTTEQKYNMSFFDFQNGTKPDVDLPWGFIVSSALCIIIGVFLIVKRK